MLQQVNGHSSGSDAQGRESLREDLQEFLGGEVPLHQLDDLTKVNPVTLETESAKGTSASVLRCLQARYTADTFYTNAGCTLVALNPFKPVPQLYSPELMREYHAAPQPQKLKPHIFTVGEQTYRNVRSLIEPVNQSIVVSGESGAGKTWTSRCLMKFYAVVAASPTSWESHKIAERIEQRILNSNPVMEAFGELGVLCTAPLSHFLWGNACTLRNNNSSRFGKFIQLQLNRDHQMTGAAIQTYLLEKTRVACQDSTERNFHIFYQVCTRRGLQLPRCRAEMEDCFEVTREAMLHLGIDAPTQNNIFQALAGLLHLGNIRFADSGDEAQPCRPMDDGAVRTSALLLRLPEDPLLETLRIRTIRAGRQQQVFRKPCSQAECDTRRDCLAKLVYARLFDWLVSVINSSVCADPASWTTFIGSRGSLSRSPPSEKGQEGPGRRGSTLGLLRADPFSSLHPSPHPPRLLPALAPQVLPFLAGLLDVYGFESFPHNSLEQLCINYANEKLQQHFVAHYLRAQQEEYAVEGLEWSFVNYQDNQTCLDLIEGSPISICSLINEECRLNRPSSAAQLQTRIESALAGSPCLGHNKLSPEPSFIVLHYAGSVRYHTAGLVEKNKDPIPPELTRLLQQSQDPLLKVLFPADPEEKSQEEPSGQSRAPVLTVVSKFKVGLVVLRRHAQFTHPSPVLTEHPRDCLCLLQASLEQLLQVLQATTPHYIRCIKPNSQGRAQALHREEVTRWARAASGGPSQPRPRRGAQPVSPPLQVLNQLEACGLVETIHISAAGFPIRVSHRTFVERYASLRRLHPQGSPHAEQATLRALLQDILHTLPALEAATPAAPAGATPAPVHCGRTKVFMTDATLELLERGRAQVLEQCARCIQAGWRRHRRREQERRRRAAVCIQAGRRGCGRAAIAPGQLLGLSQHIRMAFLASKELDGVEEKHSSQAPRSPSSFPPPLAQTKLLRAVTHLWPLGLVLANAAVGVHGFPRKLVVFACLQLPVGSPSGYTVQAQTAQEQAGIMSIRALPQGSIKFHCRKSPLRYADICPEPLPNSATGFNQILLERHRLGHV
ncbi:Unconventional myosin-XIX [Camelus dromedarius]|uniref:Unconventional myosin-XIX n=1 Tax=Camelus dromedarius TaxID=9838 RepID=A0A5N4D3S9_CAMDR|nr:Unconventional myosin-XIX [Camelus dromedarius]